MEIGDANRMQEYDARVLDHRRSYDANARLTRLTERTNRRRVSNSDPSNWRKSMEIG